MPAPPPALAGPGLSPVSFLQSERLSRHFSRRWPTWSPKSSASGMIKIFASNSDQNEAQRQAQRQRQSQEPLEDLPELSPPAVKPPATESPAEATEVTDLPPLPPPASEAVAETVEDLPELSRPAVKPTAADSTAGATEVADLPPVSPLAPDAQELAEPLPPIALAPEATLVPEPEPVVPVAPPPPPSAVPASTGAGGIVIETEAGVPASEAAQFMEVLQDLQSRYSSTLTRMVKDEATEAQAMKEVASSSEQFRKDTEQALFQKQHLRRRVVWKLRDAKTQLATNLKIQEEATQYAVDLRPHCDEIRNSKEERAKRRDSEILSLRNALSSLNSDADGEAGEREEEEAAEDAPNPEAVPDPNSIASVGGASASFAGFPEQPDWKG